MVCRELTAYVGGWQRRVSVFATALFALGGTGAELPSAGGDVHEGVASCADGQCHGKGEEDFQANVWRNEYRLWNDSDPHAGAYRTLLSVESRAIAAKLGLAEAHTAGVCLDCHADNVPEDKRGTKFQITDGVGCEACHGGAGRWIESHAAMGATHEDNIDRGMYATDRPFARARLCLSCHMGTGDQFATHQIMAAGHPRLSFQLDVYSGWHEHYEYDDDYLDRKDHSEPANLWLTGLAVAALRTLELRSGHDSPHMEFAYYQCDSCHHAMRDPFWDGSPGVDGAPGALRPADAPLTILEVALGQMAPEGAAGLSSHLQQWRRALGNSDETTRAAEALYGELADLVDGIAKARYSRAQLRKLRDALLSRAGAGGFRYQATAEQACFAVETLCYELDDCSAQEDRLQSWLESAAGQNDGFDRDRYQGIAKDLRTMLLP